MCNRLGELKFLILTLYKTDTHIAHDESVGFGQTNFIFKGTNSKQNIFNQEKMYVPLGVWYREVWL